MPSDKELGKCFVVLECGYLQRKVHHCLRLVLNIHTYMSLRGWGLAELDRLFYI